ncbi:hypothetical protein UlMin_026531 [Ulmus minor]
MKIEIVSEELIKPSSQIPDNLKSYKLSLLDQLSPSFYIPIVLFYPPPQHCKKTTIVDKLKKSLSETLSRFYPLAGRIQEDGLSVELENGGVMFKEARVNKSLSETLKNPENSSIQQLLPLDPYRVKTEEEGVPAMAVQLNLFSCGGMGIGLCMSHKITDGTTLSSFLSAWASSTSNSGENDEDYITPHLHLAQLFPPKDIHVVCPRNLIKRGKIVTKRFVFDKSSLAALKTKIGSSPSRVEAVTALICKTAMNSTTRSSNKSSMVISHVVNLRPRMDPPLPEQAFGNIWRCAVAQIVQQQPHKLELQNLVAQLREEIQKVDKNYVAKLQSEQGFIEACESLKEVCELVSQGVVPFFKFSSWVRFPFYETDFGWGKPIWACITNVPIKDAVILMSNSSGDGIEAWINLEEEDMLKFYRDPELLEFASQAPC